MRYLLTVLLCLSLTKNYLLVYGRSASRIVGGNVARVGEFPWMAAIYKTTADGSYFCGGTLINDEFILTAAQCVSGATLFRIQLGSTTLSTTDGNRLTLSTSRFFVHDEYDPNTLIHDIGLIRLHMTIQYTDYIQQIDPANLGYIFSGAAVTAAGWGQTSDQSSQLPNELHYVDVTLLSNFECGTYYGSQLTSEMTCAVGNLNEGICFGDIGGPLLSRARIGNHSMVVGVASFISQNGCESLYPSGFTRTDAHYIWIKNTTRDN